MAPETMIKALNASLLWLLFFSAITPGTLVAAAGSFADALLQAQEEAVAGILDTRKAEWNKQVLDALVLQGDENRDQANYARAIAIYNIIEKASQLTGDQSGIALAINRVAIVYDYQGKDDEGMVLSRKSLQISEQIGDQARISDALVNIGNIQLDQGAHKEAIENFEKSLVIREKLGDKSGMSACLNNIGIVHDSQGDYEKARSFYLQGLKLREELGDKLKIGSSLNNIGNSYFFQGNNSKAIDHYKRGLELFESIGDRKRTAVAMDNIGSVYRQWGDYVSALEYYRKALEIQEVIGDEELHLTISHMGGIFIRLGNYKEALEYFERSLLLAEKMGRLSGVSDSLCGIGRIHTAQGNYSQAADFVKRCAASREKANFNNGLAGAYSDLGVIYSRQGNQKLALLYFQKSLDVAKDLGEAGTVAGALNLRGNTYFHTGQYKLAEKDYSEALAKSEALQDKQNIALTLTNLGHLYSAQGRSPDALAVYEKSLALHKEMGSQEEIARTWVSIADVYLQAKDFGKALSYSMDSANLAEKIRSPEIAWQALTTVGTSQRALHRVDDALQSLGEAVRVIEALRLQIAGGETDIERYFENKVEPYHQLVSLNFELGRPAEALLYAERAKAAVLADVLSRGKLEVNKAMTDAERREERKWREKIVSLNTQIHTESTKDVSNTVILKKLQADLDTARSKFEEFRLALYVAHPELKLQRGETEIPESASLRAGPGEAILEYVVTKEFTYVFAITGDGIQAERISVPRQKLAADVEQFRSQLSARSPAFKSSAIALHRILIAPVVSQFKGNESLVVVPDLELWGLPFQALIDGKGKYLVDQHPISYSHSIVVAKEMNSVRRKKASGATLLALGNPLIPGAAMEETRLVYRGETLEPLPGTETEVNLLQQIYGADSSLVLTGENASEATWKREAGKYKVLHLATHGILNSTSPLYSHVVLSKPPAGSQEDGLLEAWEILQMNLSAGLVVLSACETALGRIGAGEGMIGLSWAFFVAGSDATVVSQWKVETESTSALMVAFHTNLKKGQSRAQALQSASLEVSRQSKYRHPFYWAGFVVIGDPS